jgi:putative transposase
MVWARMVAYITGTADQELLLRNEYLAAENRILRAQIKRSAEIIGVSVSCAGNGCDSAGTERADRPPQHTREQIAFDWFLARKADGQNSDGDE